MTKRSDAMTSKLYAGWVSHQRLRPTRHSLRYRVFWMLLDLDDIDAAGERLKLFSHNRANALSLRDEDYGDGSARPLKAQVLEHLAAAGMETSDVRVMLLTMPRIFGYGFNPLSLYFISSADGRPMAILYEVSNTFGERHSYLMPVTEETGGPVTQRCPKGFYVSPFLDMDLDYRFRVRLPGKHVGLNITASDAEGPMLLASLRGTALPIRDRTLLRLLLTYPLLTLKVTGGIHWHALRLFAKGMRLRTRPHPPEHPVSFSR
ncbi:hypothetical protein A7A08_02475 [Methyloligella halotolerans]|uniref:DUF1365 domain-containing protein n=1 Tax=Methyloligella halotolerans TaxID=1177755 RepID=A0A1E2RWU9_9HYPH|nr:DUF1365 family protein [Methyloligella halotolerans]ODA66707.1 hypothetical protein A7A08_02475 [Methyloligella halotolerans]